MTSFFCYTGPRFINKYGISNADFHESYEGSEKTISENQELLAFAKSQYTMQSSVNKIPSDANAILQCQIGFTDNNFSVVGTTGAGPCVILAAYNPKAKEAFVTHIDALTTLKSLNLYFQKLSNEGTQKLQVFLSGGDNSSKENVIDIIKMVKETPYLDIVYSDLINTDNLGSKSFAINAKTGEFYTDVKPTQLIHHKDFKMDMVMLGFSMKQTDITLAPELHNSKDEVTLDKMQNHQR
jgi:hypothetical protein